VQSFVARPVARFEAWRGKMHFRGSRYLFLIIFLKQIFLGTRKFGGVQKIFGGHCPRMSPVATGLFVSGIDFQLRFSFLVVEMDC